MISVLIDLDSCEMKFARNGEDMGIAFSNFNVDKFWYPAISLAADQECELVFGDGLQKLS